MANKQFRMEKDGEHHRALISPILLSKTNMFNFYMKKSLNTFLGMNILFFDMFLDWIWLQKTVFWTNIKIKYFFSIWQFNILQFTKTFVNRMGNFSFKKQINGCNIIFHKCATYLSKNRVWIHLYICTILI